MKEIRTLKVRRSQRRRGTPTEQVQPAMKKRKLDERNHHNRVLQNTTTGEKRKDRGGETEQRKKEHKTENTEVEEKREEEQCCPPPRMKGENWEEYTDKRWKEHLENRIAQIEKDIRLRDELIAKARRKEKS